MENSKKLSNCGLPWDKLKKANILITGANGLIASSLAEELLEVNQEKKLDLNIYALCRTKEKAEKRFRDHLEDPAFHLLIQDVCAPLEFDIEFRYIIHAASSAHPGAFNTSPVDVMKANFLGTLNLLEYAVKYKNTRFLLVSSSEVYGENEAEVQLFTEDINGTVDYTKFRSCYPESKRAAETLCMSFKKQYGADVVIVRPAYIYGKNILDSNTRADVYFLRQVMNKKDIVMYSKGTQVRSYCYVNDCTAGMLYAALAGESGEIYNIGDESCVITLWDYAQKLADIGGVELRYEPETTPAGTVFLKTTRCILDTTKLRGLGWKPQYSLEEGIKDMLL
ncbi:MAG: NAD-dependent epimerase/dehydratase family protein [Lachnospiraceae bacterium]|nr:NAD-dependent epimerase/dehydratase family protein [Lachnospiraceae bacterium]MDD3795793.1 NAD-dependent epimerase/dehydratase family protein [Lachnospiraceae bacterium]